jgi:hypothetical protein
MRGGRGFENHLKKKGFSMAEEGRFLNVFLQYARYVEDPKVNSATTCIV